MELKRPFTELEWAAFPPAARQYIETLEKTILSMAEAMADLQKRTENLENRVNRNSQNSNQPPSSDKPFAKPEHKKKKSRKKTGGQKGHRGHKQQKLNPNETVPVKPMECSCGCKTIEKMKPFYTHQQIELPEIELDVTHFVLHKGSCRNCGKTVSAKLSKEQSFGYGPRMTALIAELSGIQGSSRKSVQQFLNSVMGVPISTGGIQKVIDRVSEAAKPAYDKIAETARSEKVGYIDETSWFKNGKLQWLWVMVTASVAVYLVHPRRSREAFNELVKYWQGILVSDNYRVYQHWVNQNQQCLAHYIRKARGLSESSDRLVSAFGEEMHALLQQLCHFAKAPPSKRKWNNFYTRFLQLLMLHDDSKNEAGKLTRSLISVMDSLWVFLDEQGVEPTNNRAERALRFGVIWRKRCFGSQSDKGKRWVERILSIKETCRLKSKSSFVVLVDLVQAYFKDQKPNLAWIV